MKALLMSMTLGLGMLVAVGAEAQAPATAPAGSTGLCKDGSWYSGASKKGACRGHQGVKEWYGAAGTTAANTATTPKAGKSAKSKAAAETAPVATSAAAPAGSTGLCKDGSYTSGASKKGACRGHKGVKEWYGGAAATAAAPKAAPAPSANATSATASASAPAGTTGLCKDGSWYSGASKKGACRGHKGVREWYGAGAATGAAAATVPARSTPSMPMTPRATAPAPMAPAPTVSPTAAPATTRAPEAGSPETRAAAPGGGNGQVWVNSASKVYHCQDDRYYGKTKKGEYMSESAAIAAGNRAARGKSCSQ